MPVKFIDLKDVLEYFSISIKIVNLKLRLAKVFSNTQIRYKAIAKETFEVNIERGSLITVYEYRIIRTYAGLLSVMFKAAVWSFIL